MAAGIPRIIIAANAYGWLQTRGPASCVIDASTPPLVGNTVRVSHDDDGGIEVRDETAAQIDYQDIGYAMETAPDLDFGHIFLTIE